MHNQTHSSLCNSEGDERQTAFDCPAALCVLLGSDRFRQRRCCAAFSPLFLSLFSSIIATTHGQDSVLFLKRIINVNGESFRQDTGSFFSSSLNCDEDRQLFTINSFLIPPKFALVMLVVSHRQVNPWYGGVYRLLHTHVFGCVQISSKQMQMKVNGFLSRNLTMHRVCDGNKLELHLNVCSTFTDVKQILIFSHRVE